ncbi:MULTISPECIES: hypothetical protein [Pseudomonas]|uniref:hypothetical protein n=1 Tax=Pseudomonas TaxID=286 RepID=UPI000A480841|nr:MULTISPECIES: hypothetical protein [Pseudomonas]MBS5838856.1 hypothetical protein [Pseudomonas sp.]NMZ98429.1 hypothetical protein [Pseudomonas lundensis]
MSSNIVMVGGSLLSFVDGFSFQERQDIMNSLALAQYSADKSLKNDKLLVDWFDLFTESLMAVGWEVDEDMRSGWAETGIFYSLEEAVLDGLKHVNQASLRASLQHSIEMLKLDKVSQDIFESRNRNGAMAHYQFVPCEHRKALGSYMFVSGMKVKSRVNLDNIFFDGKKIKADDALDVQTACSGFYLKTENYNPHRDVVLQKMSEIGDDFFKNLKQ